MRKTRLTTLALLLSFALATEASAVEINKELVQKVASEVAKHVPVKELAGELVASTRRSLSLGPTLGVGLGTGVPDGADVPVSVGLGGFYFQNRMFDPVFLQAVAKQVLQEELEDLVRKKLEEHLLSKAREGLGQALKTGIQVETDKLVKLTKEDYVAIAKDIWAALQAELKKKLAANPPVLPAPRFGLLAEVGHLPASDHWGVRASLGYGISKVIVGPTMALHIGDPASFALGTEVTVNALFGQGPRPWHVQGFARYEWYLFSHAAFGHQAAIGARLVLDVI